MLHPMPKISIRPKDRYPDYHDRSGKIVRDILIAIAICVVALVVLKIVHMKYSRMNKVAALEMAAKNSNEDGRPEIVETRFLPNEYVDGTAPPDIPTSPSQKHQAAQAQATHTGPPIIHTITPAMHAGYMTHLPQTYIGPVTPAYIRAMPVAPPHIDAVPTMFPTLPYQMSRQPPIDEEKLTKVDI